MGLDVTAYSQLTYLAPQPKTDEEIDAVLSQGAVRLYNANGFYRLGQQPEGYYLRAEGSASQWIRCGAYSRYGRWREELARLAGWPLGQYELYGQMRPSFAASSDAAKEGPFLELIQFGDNEGSIGSEAATRLAADFQRYYPGILERAALLPADQSKEFMRYYAEWHQAFILASASGAVVFH